MCQLWIIRINAACRANDMAYSRFMNGVKKLHLEMYFRSFNELVIHNMEAFQKIIGQIKAI
jgi:large subunit ribosomal protein L20